LHLVGIYMTSITKMHGTMNIKLSTTLNENVFDMSNISYCLFCDACPMAS